MIRTFLKNIESFQKLVKMQTKSKKEKKEEINVRLRKKEKQIKKDRIITFKVMSYNLKSTS